MLAIIGAHLPTSGASLSHTGSCEQLVDDRPVQIDFTDRRDACAIRTTMPPEIYKR